MRELSSESPLSFVSFCSHRRVGGCGGFGWLGGGEVGAADPDHGGVDDQGEQRDPGGDQEPAGEPGGEGVVVDRRGHRPAGMRAGCPARAARAAWAWVLWAAAVQATVPSSARPMAPPSCWPVLSRLEATPESASGTRLSATRDNVTNSRAAPAPMTMVGPSTALA